MGWDEAALKKYYAMIPNVIASGSLKEDDYKSLFGGDNKSLIMRLVPDATEFDKEDLRKMMDRVRELLAKA